MKLTLGTNPNGQTMVLWDAVSDASSYIIKVCNPETWDAYADSEVMSTGFTLDFLPDDIESCMVLVAALDADGGIICCADECVTLQSIADANVSLDLPVIDMEVNDVRNRAVVPLNATPTVTIQNTTSTLNSVGVTWTTANVSALEMVFNHGAAQPISGTSRTFTGLASGTTHAFWIRGRNSAGVWGWWDSRNLTALSVAPTNIRADSTHHSITVWILPDLPFGATGYEVELDGRLLRWATRERWNNHWFDWNCVFGDLEPCREYTYRVRSVNGGGPGPFSPTRRIRTRLAPPANLRITNRTTNSMTVQWDPSIRATSYLVTFDGVAHSVTGTSRTFTNLDPGRLYGFDVIARNGHGDSLVSRGSGMTFSEAPTTMSAIPGTTFVSLSWDRPVGASSFEIEMDGRITRANNAFHSFVELTPNTPYNYRIRSINAGGAGPFSAWQNTRTLLETPINLRVSSATTTGLTLQWNAVAGATVYDVTFNNVPHVVSGTSITITNLTPGTQFHSTVRARNAHTQSANAWINVSTLAEPPTSITASPGIDFISLSWDRPIGATGFEIEIDGRIIRTGNVFFLNVTHLTPNTAYPFRIRSINASGAGPFSPWQNTSTLLSTPLNLRVTSATTTSVTIQWDAVSGASSYDVTFGGVVHSVVGTSRTFSGLAPDSRNNVTVRARSAQSQSNVSGMIVATTLPPVPQNITTTAAINWITISWDRIVNATGYEVVFNGNTMNVGASTFATISHTVSSLAVNSRHTFRVRARNAAGFGAFSSEQSASTLMANTDIPSGLRVVSVTTDTATMAWNAVAGAISYDLSFNGVVHNSTATTRTVTGLTPNTAHHVNVRSRNTHTHSGASGNVVATTLPSIPPNVSATATTNAVTVSWDRTVNIASYDIVFNGVSRNVAAMASFRQSSTFTGLTPGTMHRFSVRARNAGGGGDFSPEQSISTLLATPLGLRLTAVATHSATLEWNAAAGATSYEVRLNNNEFFTTASTSKTLTNLEANSSYTVAVRALSANAESAFTGNLPFMTLTSVPINVRATATLNSVNVQWDAVPGATNYDVNFNGTTTALGNVLSRNFAGLANDTLHTFSVRSRNARGSSAFSPQQSIRTLPLAPPVPTGLRATATHNTITAHWNETIRATQYEVNVQAPGPVNIVSGTSGTTQTITGLNPNTSYVVVVRAGNVSGWSAWSPIVTMRTDAAPPIPSVPLNVRATNIGQNQMTIGWSAVANASSYDVEFNGNIFSTTSTSRLFSGLQANTLHTFRARAIGIGGASAFSPNNSARTRRSSNPGNNHWPRNRNINGRPRQCFGDPIDAASGAFLWDYTLLDIDAKDTMDFTIYYNSKNDNTGDIGHRWTHSYSYSLEMRDAVAYFVLPSGESIAFLYDETTGTYQPETEQNQYALAELDGQYIISHIDNTEYVFAPHLEAIRVNGIVDTTITNNNDGRPMVITGKYGSAFRLSYADGKLVSVSDPIDNKMSLAYAGENLHEITNAAGDSIAFTYDESGNLLEVSDFSGVVYLSNAYTEDSAVSGQTLIGRGTSTVQMDSNNHTNAYINEQGNAAVYHYDENQNVSTVEHALGTIEYKYNAARQLVEQSDELGNITQMSYDDSERLAEVVYPDGNTETLEYNNFNLPTHITNTDGTEVMFTYDDRGNLLVSTDERGNAEHFVYDAHDNAVMHTDKLGSVSHFTYDNTGQLNTLTDPLGNTYTFIHDALGRLVYSESPLGQTASYQYDAVGDLISTVQNGETESFTYDKNGNCLSITDKMGSTQTFAYDEMSNLVSETDFIGNKQTYVYNTVGLLTEAIDPLAYKESFEHDALDNVTHHIDKNGNPTVHVYNEASQLTQIQKPCDSIIKFEYDKMGQVIMEVDPRGNATSFTYDDAGRVLNVTDALGYVTAFSYDEAGNIVSETNAHGVETQYAYDAMNNLVRIESTQGTMQLVYDAAGRLVETRDEADNTEKSAYDADGNRTASIDKEGNKTTFNYNQDGLLSEEVDPLGGITKYQYDKNGNRTSVEDANGNVTAYAYNANGQPIKITDPLGGETLLEYNARGEVIAATDANGNVTRCEYDGNGNAVKEINPAGGIITYAYDALNRLISVTDENEQTNSFVYDASSNQVKHVDANGNLFDTAYDTLNRPVKLTDANGDTLLTYDKKDNIIVLAAPDGAVTEYEYDSADQLTKVYDALGHATSFEYDKLGRLVKTVDANGNATTMDYSPSGNLMSTTDPEGNKETFTYNAMNWVTEKVDADGVPTKYTYDGIGQVLAITDVDGNSVNLTYNPRGEVESVTDANGNKTDYQYDGNGNLTQLTDANGETFYLQYDSLNNVTKLYSESNQAPTIYHYDKKGQKIKEISPLETERSFKYDGNGNVIELTDEDGNATVYEYNMNNQVSAIAFAGDKKICYRYNKAGQLVEMQDWNGVSSFTRDLLGRITKATDHNGYSTEYTYDNVGNKVAMHYPNGSKVKYAYRLNNQLKSVTETDDTNDNAPTDNTLTGNASTAFEYTPAGSLKKVTHANGAVTNYGYGKNGALTSMNMTSGNASIAKTFAYDKVGNILSIVQEGLNADTKRYNYDKVNQLVAYTENGMTTSYTYDGRGNRVSKVSTSAQSATTETSYTYNALNQLVSKTTDGTHVECAYDKRGNLQMEYVDGVLVKSYTFDASNTIVEGNNLQTGDKSVYQHNGFGLRTGLKQLKHMQDMPEMPASVVKDTVYIADYTSENYNDIMLVENAGVEGNATIPTVATILHGLGSDRLSQITTAAGSSRKLHFQSNIVGSAVLASNANGDMVCAPSFNPWGKLRPMDMSHLNGLEQETATRFTVHSYDKILGKYHAGARLYDAKTARMTSIDPAYADTNLYRYALNNPLTYVDLDGQVAFLAPFLKAGIRIGGGALLGAGIELGAQMITWGINGTPINWRRVGSAAISGGVAAATSPIFGGVVRRDWLGNTLGSFFGEGVSSGFNGNLWRNSSEAWIDGVSGGIVGVTGGTIWHIPTSVARSLGLDWMRNRSSNNRNPIVRCRPTPPRPVASASQQQTQRQNPISRPISQRQRQSLSPHQREQMDLRRQEQNQRAQDWQRMILERHFLEQRQRQDGERRLNEQARFLRQRELDRLRWLEEQERIRRQRELNRQRSLQLQMQQNTRQPITGNRSVLRGNTSSPSRAISSIGRQPVTVNRNTSSRTTSFGGRQPIISSSHASRGSMSSNRATSSNVRQPVIVNRNTSSASSRRSIILPTRAAQARWR